MSMKGSGIYSFDITLGVDCDCGYAWDMDFVTNDWGNIDEYVTCPKCKEEFSFRYEEKK